jgi:hypothetical protein
LNTIRRKEKSLESDSKLILTEPVVG